MLAGAGGYVPHLSKFVSLTKRKIKNASSRAAVRGVLAESWRVNYRYHFVLRCLWE